MKHAIITFSLLLISVLVSAQTQTENYISNVTPQVEVTTEKALQDLSPDAKIESITYYDGLGRPKQSIAKQAGGQKQDLITPTVYDAFGRQAKNYLPFARSSSSLNFDTSIVPNNNGDVIPIHTQYKNKYPDDFSGMSATNANAYSKTHYEASPLNRVLEQAAPGKDWAVGSGHTIKFDYQANSSSDNVQLFKGHF
jgi:hypothetical protein